MRRNFMQRILGLVVLLASACVGNVFAQATTYTATSVGKYTTFTNYTSCSVSPCQNFDGTMGFSGSFTTSSPLAPNLASHNIYPLVTSFNFESGLLTYSNSDSQVRVYRFTVSTDATGKITSTAITIDRWMTAGVSHGVGDRLSTLFTGPDNTASTSFNTFCPSASATSPAGVVDTCGFPTLDTNTSRGQSSIVQWISPSASVKSIPTLSQSGMAIMATLMGLFGFAALRRRT